MNIGLEKYRYYYETLRDNGLFAELSHDAMNQLLEISTSQCWPQKACILNTNSTFYHFYIILSGRVKAYNFDMQKDRQLTLFLLSQNDIFDISSLLQDKNYDIYYETIDSTEVLSIPLTKMKLWMAKHPFFNRPLARYALQKMGTLQESVKGIVLDETSARLAKLLYKHSNSHSGKIEKIDDLSHVELAALIGTTRAVLNRHLQDFKQQGLIHIGRKHLEILDLDLLKAKFEEKKQ